MLFRVFLRERIRVRFLCLVLLSATPAPAGAQEANLTNAIRTGALTFELRPRYETASQAGLADAEAFTVRTRLGWQTAKWRDLQGAIEFDAVTDLGGDHNDGIPPAEPFATIADPEGAELNRLQISWTPSETFTATIGRQRINFDDQRFVGAANWRQDDQAFDALRVDLRHGPFQATYAYLDHINRIFADDLDWDSQSHLVNSSYAFGTPLKLTAFAYLLDFDGGGAAQSNATYGVRATGATTFGGVQLDYAASYATQADYGNNPVAYDADYWTIDLSATHGPVTGRIGYESLEGDGPGQRFITPLATGHAFAGWADVFLTTPHDGVEHLFISGIYRVPITLPTLSSPTITATWRDFQAERTGADLGEEFDVQFTGALTRQLSFVLKYADYDGTGAPPDTTRAWFGLEYKI